MAIRAAAAEQTTRMGALQAMRREAARLKEEAETEREADRSMVEAETEIGGVEAVQGGYRARVRNTDGAGAQKVTQGPRRHDERRAKADLDAMRATAANKPTREEYLTAKQTEAHRLQEHAGFETEIRPQTHANRFRD